MAKKILVICEGTKKEPGIFRHVQQLGLLPADVSIVSYGTNIYKLYDQLQAASFGNPDGWDSLDIQLVMAQAAKTDADRRLLFDKYTDILLIFDFDPQDSFFRNHEAEACNRFAKLMDFFAESTIHGKLYLSYPMVEALLHISMEELDLHDIEAFQQRKFTVGELRKGRYKHRVDQEGEHSVEQYNHDAMVSLIRRHLAKAEYLTDHEVQDVVWGYSEDIAAELIQFEINTLKENGYGYVVSSSLFYVAESYPQLLQLHSVGSKGG